MSATALRRRDVPAPHSRRGSLGWAALLGAGILVVGVGVGGWRGVTLDRAEHVAASPTRDPCAARFPNAGQPRVPATGHGRCAAPLDVPVTFALPDNWAMDYFGGRYVAFGWGGAASTSVEVDVYEHVQAGHGAPTVVDPTAGSTAASLAQWFVANPRLHATSTPVTWAGRPGFRVDVAADAAGPQVFSYRTADDDPQASWRGPIDIPSSWWLADVPGAGVVMAFLVDRTGYDRHQLAQSFLDGVTFG